MLPRPGAAPTETPVSFQLPELPFHEAGLVFAVLTAAILLGPLLAKRLRIPDVVMMVLLGFAVGPTGLGLLERQGVVEMLGSAGLLYLMFVAGLELDLDDFIANRRHSIGFGALTFVIPMVLGTSTGLLLGFEPLAAVLLASCWASHTLLTYPIFQRAGTVSNRAVATTVGATIITDTAALLVLAVVARAYDGELSLLFWATLIPSMLALTAAAVWGLPRVARWFFSGEGQDRSLRFVFVLVVLFLFSALFEIIGVEAIVGAFLAGLALNRSVPNGGALMERVEAFGDSLFVPLFLIATGMLIDVSVLVEPRTLLIGGAFTLVATVGKLAASMISGRLFGYERDEVGAMFGLSNAQAAATLAAIIVGLNVGLLDTDTVNAVILVILVTCIIASTASARYAPRLPRPDTGRDLGEVVVVPIANPASAPRLMRLASAFARADGGLVVPLMVSPYDSDEELERMRSLESDVVAVAQSAGAEAKAVLRIDASPESGIAHTIREHQGTMLVLGWKGATGTRGSRFGGITDAVIARTNVPTMLTYEGEGPYERILVVIDESVAFTDPTGPLTLALATARHLSRDLNLPVEILSNVDEAPVTRMAVDKTGKAPNLDGRRRSIVVRDRARATDLIVLPALRDDAHLRAVPGRLLKAVPDGAALLVAIGDAAPIDQDRPGLPSTDSGAITSEVANTGDERRTRNDGRRLP
ncbi:cation:proton antiporter [Nitriliruptoraceae bacterium ZYF776]|nr:cation:proton antiporter [Profundirhabdus halotolerans]